MSQMMKETATTTMGGTVTEGKLLSVRNMVQIGMLVAIATVLMLLEIPLPFAPSFYEIDFSEVPVLIGAFAMGPVAGAVIELLKILVNFVVNGTMTAGVGEAANLIIGWTLVLPASMLYRHKKTRTNALIGMIIGIVGMIIVGSLVNIYVLLPVYAKAFGMPMEALVGMGTAVNPKITSLSTFALFAVAPFNLIKGTCTAIITMAIYKPLSRILHR